MRLYTLNPTQDSRWDDLVASHPQASVFHDKGWLKALARTYRYRSIALTSTPPGERLRDGIVFCEIKSWIDGSRLVSLPFADHCEPMQNEIGNSFEFRDWMRNESQQNNWKYVEVRPVSWETEPESLLIANQSFWFHKLDLTPSIEQVFRRLHKNCIQRRIRRAEHEHLSYEIGTSEALSDDFYRLLMITRRRQKLLPQPRAWFRNLVACMGSKLEIRVARKDEVPIAAMLTLSHRRTVYYKYGCSNEKFHHLAGMPFLLWKLIDESKAAGANEIDFGRTDLENDGLTQFKDRFGTERKKITYFRYPQGAQKKGVVASYLPMMRSIFSILPDALSSRAGSLVYRHIG